jgi:hypothetical protein
MVILERMAVSYERGTPVPATQKVAYSTADAHQAPLSLLDPTRALSRLLSAPCLALSPTLPPIELSPSPAPPSPPSPPLRLSIHPCQAEKLPQSHHTHARNPARTAPVRLRLSARSPRFYPCAAAAGCPTCVCKPQEPRTSNPEPRTQKPNQNS